jgi:diguanylate cyclase (GGDEF)-like protein
MMETNILVIEDSEPVRREIIHILRNYSLASFYHEAGDGIEALTILREIKMDLIICDVVMPRLDGFRFLSMARSRDELRNIPIIFLTARDDRDSKLQGLEQGASDYITKPFDPAEMVARVRIHLQIRQLQEELKLANEKLMLVSHTDHLTGLHNRRYLMDVLERELSRVQRSGSFLSLLILDIDHFKEINDQYGHQGGDMVLAEAASVFRKELRVYDTAARYGGDEFVAVIPGASLSEAVAVAERIRDSVEKSRFSERMEDVSLTVSIGIAVYPSPGIETMEDFIREADGALYRAKAGGRNRVEGPVPPPPATA